jgi:hypothetical protein
LSLAILEGGKCLSERIDRTGLRGIGDEFDRALSFWNRSGIDQHLWRFGRPRQYRQLLQPDPLLGEISVLGGELSDRGL